MKVISLTTIPSRMPHIGPTLQSLLNQRTAFDEINLYIPKHYRRFPDYDGSLPDVPEGISLRQVDEDFGPASKVLHAVRDYADQACEILFCDDDRLYPPDWTESFLQARHHKPTAAIANMAFELTDWIIQDEFTRLNQPRALSRNAKLHTRHHIDTLLWRLGLLKKPGNEPPHRRYIYKAGYRDFFQGYGGVMIRPEFFPKEVFDIPDIFWAVDDIWLSGMLAVAGIPIWVPANVRAGSDRTSADASDPLHAAIIDNANRQEADRACVEFFRETYGIWR